MIEWETNYKGGNMIRLGTVGTSGICEHFLSGAALTNQFILSAVYSRKYETGYAFGEKFGCKTVFTDLEEMAKSSLMDAVYIASPNRLHGNQTRFFLENGKHVICEKPITTSAKEYTELKALADKNGLIYMEAIIPPHTEYYAKVKEAFLRIGKPVSARFDFSQRSSRLDAFLRGEKINIFDMSLCAGTLMDLGVYCVYGAIDFLGVPNQIYANAHYLPNGADGSGMAVFTYEDFSAVLSYSKIAQGALGSEIIGEKGVLKIASVSQYAGVTLVLNGKEEVITEFPSRAEFMSGEALNFARFIQNPLENIEKYEQVSEMCFNVHTCMDEIKRKAQIKYL